MCSLFAYFEVQNVSWNLMPNREKKVKWKWFSLKQEDYFFPVLKCFLRNLSLLFKTLIKQIFK